MNTVQQLDPGGRRFTFGLILALGFVALSALSFTFPLGSVPGDTIESVVVEPAPPVTPTLTTAN
jgi:hypothetical protein